MLRDQLQTDQKQEEEQRNKLIWFLSGIFIILLLNLFFFTNVLQPKSHHILPDNVVQVLSPILTVLSAILTILACYFLFFSHKLRPAGTIGKSSSQQRDVSYSAAATGSLSTSTDTISRSKEQANEPSLSVSLPLSTLPTSISDSVQYHISTSSPLVAISELPKSVFLFNQPLTDLNEFFGRTTERNNLIDQTLHGASTSIVGPNRIGKTWLMSYLILTLKARFDSVFRIGYLDMTSPTCQTVAGFTSSAFEALDYNNNLARKNTNPGLDILERTVKNLKAKGVIPILCIDELEGLQNTRDEFNINFFTGLRAIAQQGLVLVVASKRPLVDIVNKEISTSPFFNIFRTISLKAFTPEETRHFASIKGSQAGFSELEQMRLIEHGQQLPLRLRMAGQLIMDDKLLAAEKGTNYYRPDDPDYWRKFGKRLEEEYRAIVPED